MSLCPGLGRRAGKVRVTGNQPMDQEPRSGSLRPTHFLFIAGALRERSSQDSAQLQLGHGLWGIRSVLIEKNLSQYLSDHSRGLVYVLKVGLCAEFCDDMYDDMCICYVMICMMICVYVM